MTPSTYRLPTHISPRRYDIQLDARIGREDFFGKVDIDLEIHEEKDWIDLHAKDLTIDKGHLTYNGETHKAKIEPDPDNERITLRFSRSIPVGNASLELSFSGTANRSLKGLYLAQIEQDVLLCTQCCTIYTRAVFPCFDEPSFKAQFAFEIITAPGVTVLTNSPLLSIEDIENGKRWKFAPTKIMSTYLVAMVMGDIASTPEQEINGIPLRVWTVRGKEHLGKFAVDFTAKLLPWYEEYFGVTYHFDKYDQIAVPGTSYPAMENTGLVIFRQTALIMAEKSTSWLQEKNIAHVVAHEFAHMWFGNLVTMQWWDDIWLNEAFAEWMSYRVISELAPHYQIWDDFEESLQTFAFTADALISTHPIYNKVETSAQAEEMLDAITYLKGCAVLRMLENFMGAEDFRKGLRNYMLEFMESNARNTDLWRHLQEVSTHPITEIMESWILQGGFPLVDVEIESSEGEIHLLLKQERFYSNPISPRDNQQLWQIPLIIRYADDKGTHVQRHLLVDKKNSVALEIQGTLHWCTVNADQVGFYRQNPSVPLLEKLLEHIDQLTPREQLGLLSDQWSLTRSRYQSLANFLKVLVTVAHHSDNYNVTSMLVEHLRILEGMIEDSSDPSIISNFRTWVGELFKDQLKTLGYVSSSDETNQTAQQRVAVIAAMASLAHDPDAITRSRIGAEQEAQNPTSVDPNLAAQFVVIHAQFGDEAVFNTYANIYKERRTNGASPQSIHRYLRGLLEFREPKLVSRTLDLFEENIIPTEDVRISLVQMLEQRHSQTLTWEYIKRNWERINGIGGGGFRLIKAAGNLPYAMRNDFVEFCETHVKGTIDMSYAQALELMDQLEEFRSRCEEDLIHYFRKDGIL